MDEMKSKVYVLCDERSRILRCEGGYTMGNIENISEWTLIDEGTGDRYNLCQSNYFDPPLYEEHGVPIWELVDGKLWLRAQQEVDADIAALIVTPTATGNITAGEYFTVNGILYKAISNIPNGGYIIEGQNVIKTTIEEQLYELAQKGE